jgi:hypothetical protein
MPMTAPWAFIGLFAGIWKLAAVAATVAFVVWRQGWWRHPLWRFVRPWTSRVEDVRRATADRAESPPNTPTARRGFWARVASDRWYLLLAITMALTLLAWVLTRYTIHQSTS